MDEDTILIITDNQGGTRSVGGFKVKADELAENVQTFVKQIGDILEQTPERLGHFQFEELEVHAEVSVKGTLAILGTGSELSGTGGLRFVFRRANTESSEQSKTFE